MSAKPAETVRVVVRCRPLNTKEVDNGNQRIVDVDLKAKSISAKNPKAGAAEPPKTFTFDSVYDWNSTQIGIFDDAAKPIVNSVLEGYNGTIFAYGQTGTGKTHTMEGRPEPKDLRGIIPNTFDHVFSEIEHGSADKQFLVRASYLEIYNEDIRDLLGKNPNNKLELKETVDTGVYVKDLTNFVVKGVSEIQSVLDVGKKNRTVGATLMNQDSSRSHSIFTITIECSEMIGEEAKIRVGKLNLVDLAGSERQSKTGATGDRLKEATKINLSLSALGNVISALVDGKSGHIPYRDSKLTRLLQDSLGGNTKTVMVANVGPADYNFDETISTLRYANRAKNIKNKPRINEDPKDAMLREFQEEIARLKSQLKDGGGGGDGGEERVEEVEIVKERELSSSDLQRLQANLKRDMAAQFEGKSVTKDELEKIKKDAAERGKARMQELLGEKERTEEEKKKIEKALAEQEEVANAAAEKLQQEREARAKMEKRLAAMEGKLISGDETLEDVHKREMEDLERQRQALERKKKEDEERQRQLDELKNVQAKEDEKFDSVQEEVEVKTRKLKKLFTKYSEIKAEIVDIQEEFQKDREDMLDTIRSLQQQLKLKQAMIDHFVPPEESKKIGSKAQWDDEHECWLLERLSDDLDENEVPNNKGVPVSKRPQSAGGRRPTTDYARIANAMGDQNPRFRAENIIQLELDLPERTTYDYNGGSQEQQHLSNVMFQGDEEEFFN